MYGRARQSVDDERDLASEPCEGGFEESREDVPSGAAEQPSEGRGRAARIPRAVDVGRPKRQVVLCFTIRG